MREMLAMTAAALQAVITAQRVPESSVIRFTGEFAHLEPVTIGAVLDLANEMLALPTMPCNGCGQDILIEEVKS